MNRVIELPPDIEAASGVRALSISAQRIRVQLTKRLAPALSHTLGFGRHASRFQLSVLAAASSLTEDDLMQLAHHCRALAYCYGVPCARDITCSERAQP